MNLPIEAINEYKKIYQRKNGVVLTQDEAEIKAENLLKLFYLLVEGKAI